MVTRDLIKELLKLAILCEHIYLNKDEAESKIWDMFRGFDNFHFLEDKDTDTQVGIVALTGINDIPNELFVIFRGTEANKLKDWYTDAQISLMECGVGHVHKGFYKSLLTVLPKIKQIINSYGETKVNITGHSLGGALAVLCAFELHSVGHRPILTTFGAPQVGDQEFCEHMNEAMGELHRKVVNNNDLVPEMPPLDLITGYEDCGVEHLLTEDRELKIDPSFFTKFFDKLDGRFSDILEPGTEGFKDHTLDSKDSNEDGYIPALCYILRDFQEPRNE